MGTIPRVRLRRGIESVFASQREAAGRLNIHRTTLNKILSGERGISPDLKPGIAKISLEAGLAIAHEDTGYNIFLIIEGDRHPQTMIRRVEKEDHDVHTAMEGLAWRTIDKHGPEDLTPEDKIALHIASKELAERVKADINLLIEWDERYQLGLVEYLTGKKEIPTTCVAAESRASYNY
ncbi:MAG: helix-turn-helix transcriptional regulator [Desulfotomaculaceae bacterium]|nr:helix-turn-helix transcriptional regulator [Desulfotomaculaceae bacterium]